VRWNRLRKSDALLPSALIDEAASVSGWLARALRKRIASKRFDLPTPLTPAIQVKGPKRTSTSTKFLKPLTFKRMIIFFPPIFPLGFILYHPT
jgi:hypothetical protein